MEKYKGALISVRNELIITNNIKETKENELIKESEIYQDVYNKILNYKLFQKNDITSNNKDLIIILLFRKLVLRRLAEKILAYSFAISEMEYYIKNRKKEIEKINSVLDAIKEPDEEFIKKYLRTNNI